jgi:hypothetical protein
LLPFRYAGNAEGKESDRKSNNAASSKGVSPSKKAAGAVDNPIHEV